MFTMLLGVVFAATGLSSANTRACAHRGDVKCAPENTVPAFVSAVDKGAHQVEFDLQLSKDGRLVVMHDPTVDRTTNGTGNVADLTFAELRALDAGSWFGKAFAGTRIPTFREVLEVIPPEILCNVHLKNAPGVAEAATKVIVDMKRLDHCFLAATVEQAAVAKTIVPRITICNMTRQGNQRDAYVNLTIQQGAPFIQLAGGIDGLKEAVETLHQRRITVNYFGAQDEPLIRQLTEAGVDYILTDDLDLCLAVLATYGAAPVKTSLVSGGGE